MTVNQKQPVFTKEQLALSAVLNIFLGVIFTGLFVGEGVVLKKDTASRATKLIALTVSFILFLTLSGLAFWLTSINVAKNKLIFYIAIIVTIALALRFCILTISLWRNLK